MLSLILLERSEREAHGVVFVGAHHVAVALRPDDAPERRPSRDDVADGPDHVQDSELRIGASRHAERADERVEDRNERERARMTYAGRVVEQLTEEQPDAPRVSERPLHEGAGRVFSLAGALGQCREELRRDLFQDGRMKALFSREMVDDGREGKAARLGDVAHARAVEPVPGEQRLGSTENPRAGELTFRRMASLQHPVRVYDFFGTLVRISDVMRPDVRPDLHRRLASGPSRFFF
jgi:hypothetical protein